MEGYKNNMYESRGIKSVLCHRRVCFAQGVRPPGLPKGIGKVNIKFSEIAENTPKNPVMQCSPR